MPSRQLIVRKLPVGSAREFEHADWLMSRIARHTRARPSSQVLPHWRRRRLMLCPPYRRMRPDRDRIRQALRAQSIAQRCVVTVGRVHEHGAARHICSKRGLDLCPGELVLGGKTNFLRHARTLAARFVFSPLTRQIQPITEWQTTFGRGQRQTHRNLAVLGLAQLPAVLARHSNRVTAVFAMTRIIDNPEARRLPVFCQHRHDFVRYRRKQRLIAPLGVGD